jgi:hypothetical protein
MSSSQHIILIDQDMQNNGVNRVFFQNEGCIFDGDKHRASPGLVDGLLMVGAVGPGINWASQIQSCINPTTYTKKERFRLNHPLMM